MTGLRIAQDLELPLEAAVQTFAVLAKRGAGKTYTTLVLVEEMLKARLQVVVADPVGVTWGLRASADGRGPGLPIVVLGGDHGDLPLEETSGKLIADLVVDEQLSVVLDLSRFRKGEQVRFMTDFAEQLYHRNRNPLHLVLDEADAFAPQRPMPGQQRMLGAVEDIVRRGRARGLGVSLVTQRSAVLNKDVLTQVEVLVALRTIAPQDRAAIDEWIKVHGTPEQREQLMSSLPSLPIGTAWVWSPGWLDIFQKVRIRARETFDSSATPEVGKKLRAPKQLADVDLEQLRSKLSATVEKAKADDPRALRARIAELERQLKKPAAAAPPPNPAVIDRAVANATAPLLRRIDGARSELETAANVLDETVAHLRNVAAALKGEQTALLATTIPREIRRSTGPHAPVPRIDPVPREHRRPPPSSPAPRPRVAEPPTGEVPRSEQKILDVLATLDGLGLPQAHRAAVGAFAGYAHNGGRFQNLLGSLRGRGLIEYPTGGMVALTDAGRAIAQPTGSFSTLQDLHQAWYDQVGPSSAKVLRVLVESYDEAISREELGERTGYEPRGGRFQNILGSLRTLQLVEYPSSGTVRATDLLFPALPSAR